MNAGTDYLKAKRQAQANATYAGRPRYLHQYNGVWWIDRDFVADAEEVQPGPRPEERCYKIVRFYRRRSPGGVPSRPRTIRNRVTLSEAQAHCEDPETSSSTATSAKAKRYTKRVGEWFDGYTLR
jgi:hypothetical protein